MTRRITGDDLRAYAAANFPEPYQPRMGSYGHYDALAALANQVAHWQARAETEGDGHRETFAKLIRQGFVISLGEILAVRSQQGRENGDSVARWNKLCADRADEYLKWAKPLMERET
jgi:hypothetical protein